MNVQSIVYKYDCPNCDNPMHNSSMQIGGEEWVVEVAFVLGNEFECERCGCVVYIPDDVEIVDEGRDDWEEDDDDEEEDEEDEDEEDEDEDDDEDKD